MAAVHFTNSLIAMAMVIILVLVESSYAQAPAPAPISPADVISPSLALGCAVTVFSFIFGSAFRI